jgi:hypothetical protein
VSGDKCAWSVLYTFSVKDECNNVLSSQSYTRSGGDKTAPVLTGTIPSGGTLIDACSAPAGPSEATIAAQYTDGCGGSITVVKTIGSQTIGVCGWTVTYNFTIRDECNNYASPVNITYSGSDQTPPTITCASTSPFTKSTNAGYCSYKVSGAEFNATSTDNCSTPVLSWSVSNPNVPVAQTGIGSMADKYLQFGVNTITWTATDACGNSSNCTIIVNVNNITTTTSVVVSPGTKQYSDQVTFTATVAPNNCTAGAITGTVTFKIGTLVMGSAPVIAGVATLTVPLLEPSFDAGNNGQLKPGTKTVTACYNPDGVFLGSVSTATNNLVIICEDADVTNNGQTYFTANPNNNTGTIVLSAYVVDDNDGASTRGDIRNGRVTFREVNSFGSILPNGGNIPVGLVNPGNLQEGLAVTDFNYSLSNSDISSGGKVYEVWTGLNNYYCDEAPQNTFVTLGLPGTDFVTGGGYYILSNNNNAGTYAGTPGKRMNFGFVMKWNPSGKNLQGNVNILYRRVEGSITRNLKIKSNAINTLSVTTVYINLATGLQVAGAGPGIMQFRKAVIVTKANMTDVTDPLNVISLGGNLNLTMEVFESVTNTTGAYDRIGVTLTGSGALGLLFSSYWSSGNTIAQQMNGGKIQIRNASTPAGRGISEPVVEKSPEIIPFNVKAYPNPSEHQFTIYVESSSMDKVEIVVRDIMGRIVKRIEKTVGLPFIFGEEFKNGVYLVEVRQGDNRKLLKLIKQ